jgi:hypothetical protein
MGELLDCKLEYFKSHKAPKFRALSYYGKVAKASIKIDGHSFPIARDLYDGLCQIRTRFGQEEDFCLWIRDICVDAASIDENSQQVTLTRDIYSQAAEVLVWIDSPDLGDEPVIVNDSIDLIFDTVSSFDDGSDLTKDGTLSTAWSRRFRETLKSMHLSRQEFELCLSQLTSSPWFSNVWTVQEVALSTRVPVFMAGAHAVGLNKLAKFISA